MGGRDPSPALSDLAPFDVNESLVPVREPQGIGHSNISFDGFLSEPLRLKEDLSEGCGGRLWPAGMVLAKYFLRRYRTGLADKTMSVITVIERNWKGWLIFWAELNWGPAVVLLG